MTDYYTSKRATNYEERLEPGEYYCAPTSQGRYNIWRRPYPEEREHGAYRVAIATTSAGPYHGGGFDEKANKRVAEDIVRTMNAARKWGEPSQDVDDQES